MSKIKKISVTNLKALSSKSIDFNGATAIITGRNNSGKTTFLRALTDRMRGLKSDNVVKQGEKEGEYILELTSGEKFIWTFDGKKEKISFITERNIKTSVTKDISSTYFPKVFDVDRFLTEEPAKQRAAIEKIAGIDFTEINKMFAAAYEERTYANRILKEKEAQRIQFEPGWSTDIAIAVEPMEQEWAKIGEHNLRYTTVKQRYDEKQKKYEGNIIRRRELVSALEDLDAEQMNLETDFHKAKTWMEDSKFKPKDPIQANDLKQKIEDAKKNNEAIRAKNAYENALTNAKDAELALEKIANDKKEAIRSSSLPDGFSFEGDTLLYNGFKFDRSSLSSSGIYIAALKLATLGLGEVKTLHFDASYLDKNSLAEIEKWANANDLQLLIERPDFEGGEIEYQIIESAN